MEYRATVESAIDYGKQEKMDDWIHQYLNAEGKNVPLSEGLKSSNKYYFSPAKFPISLFKRCSGPEDNMKYCVDKGWWEYKISELTKVIQSGVEVAPIIVNYVDGEFELNDGNHRLQVYQDLGISQSWVIIWINEEQEVKDFMCKYGDYVKNCTVIKR
ncbi:ParB/RepB/Spo0J family partition protein [Butyrivibrio sp. MC2021]|uniref:ParB/RepB/Spo0J family partition protein n=1 Tax=Butyrivibrio sp. MC2021 TaxID=1408306 RepID=UPI00047DE2D1|nr:ParB/RepB/Spo0J family partition protein [Butyrivibrio sp. MC2021]